MNNILVEGLYGHGAHKNKLDLRDRKWHKIAAASAPFDWSKGYDVEQELSTALNIPNFKLPVKNQGQSSSCVGQASATLESVQDAFEKGVFTEKSARDGYSQIFYPGGGSSTRDALNLLVNKGVCTEAILSSYQGGQPPSEAYMESRSDASPISVQSASSAKGSSYATVVSNIDTFAQAIRDNHGMIAMISAQNNGTWLGKFPFPPAKPEWNHELFFGRALLINGKKYCGFLNSWGSTVGDAGWQYIGEEWFNFISDGGVLYDVNNSNVNDQVSTIVYAIISMLQKIISLLQTK